jgi:hypothetical protein
MVHTPHDRFIFRLWHGMVAVLLLAALLMPASQGLAAGQPVIDRLQVDLWPEFDRPETLVIYHITLAPEVDLPVKLSLRLPKSSGGPANLAMKDSDGLLYNLKYTSMESADDWMVISFITPSAEVQLEYYDPGLDIAGTHHTFTFTWPGDYAVNTLTMSVQQPTNAANLKTVPDMGAARLARDGFYYLTAVFGAVEAGEPFTLQLSYDKADSSLSSTTQPVEPVLPVNASTNGRTSLTAMMPVLLGVLGGLLIVGGAVWFWQAGRSKNAANPRRQRHAAGGLKPNQTVVFCHQCGRQAGRSDVYCRSCGTRLRIPEN